MTLKFANLGKNSPNIVTLASMAVVGGVWTNTWLRLIFGLV